MSMTSAETHPSVFCDRETYPCPRTVLVKGRMNDHPFSSEGQARGRSSTREALTTSTVWARLSRQVGPTLIARPVFFHLRAVAAQNTIDGAS